MQLKYLTFANLQNHTSTCEYVVGAPARVSEGAHVNEDPETEDSLTVITNTPLPRSGHDWGIIHFLNPKSSQPTKTSIDE